MPSSALPAFRGTVPFRRTLMTLVAAGLLLSGCSSAAAPGGGTTESPSPGTGATAPISASPSSPTTASTAAAAYPVTVTSCGRQLTVTAAPERAVTMNQGATEVMLALGLSDRMAGTAFLDDQVSKAWAADYAKVPVLAKEYPTAEQVLATKPDFVYGSYASAFDAKAAGTQQSLNSLKIGSYLSPFGCEDKTLRPKTVTFDAVWQETRDVAKVFGVSERAESFVSAQRQALEAVQAKAPGKGLTVFWFDSGDKQAYAGAGGGAPQLILDTVGATNVFASLPGSWQDVSWEQVIKADPDVIVLADAAWSTAADKKAQLVKDPALKDLKAVRGNKFVVLPFSATTAGIRNGEAAIELAAQLEQLR